MPDNPPETLPWRVAALEKAIERQAAVYERELAEISNDLKTLKETVSSRDRNMLVAGIVFLGGIILTLGSVLLTHLSTIFPGKP